MKAALAQEKRKMREQSEISRRDFLKTAGLIGGAALFPGVIRGMEELKMTSETNTAFDRLLEGIEVRTGADYFSDREYFDSLADKVIYTGEIDRFFDYRFGHLEYRTVSFETELLEGVANYQGNAVINYTDAETPYTRIIEHKHFEFGQQPDTVISKEYSTEWKPGDEPYYPVNDEKNSELYKRYKSLADAQTKVLFGGRLAEYRYYDMHQVIERALEQVEKL